MSRPFSINYRCPLCKLKASADAVDIERFGGDAVTADFYSYDGGGDCTCLAVIQEAIDDALSENSEVQAKIYEDERAAAADLAYESARERQWEGQ